MRIRRIKKRSSKGALIQRTIDLMREIMKLERGEKCEICGKATKDLGVFHIMPVGQYKRIRFYFQNTLLVCWFPCHNDWHHNIFKAREIYKKIQELRGENFEEELKTINKIAPKISIFQIQSTHQALTIYLENLKREKENEPLRMPKL